MRKGIYFIGYFKTGSSALQDFLTLNSNQLQQNGVLYPYVEPDGIAYARQKAQRGDQPDTLPFKVKSPQNHIAYQLQAEYAENQPVPARYQPLPDADTMLQSINTDLDASGAQTLLLAAEVFVKMGFLAPETVRILQERLAVDQVTVHAILRRPDHYLASWQSQILKFGYRSRRLSGPGLKQFQNRVHFDFATALDPWVTRFGAENCVIQNYAEIRAKGGIIEAFMDQHDLRVTNPVEAQTQNTGLPFAAYDLIRRANKDLPRPQATQFRSWCRRKLHRFDVPPNSDVELFGAKNRAWMIEAFTPINERLGAMVGKPAFFEDMAEIAATRPISEATASAEFLRQVKASYSKSKTKRVNPDTLRWLMQLDTL